jgi:hypothetical protein
MESTSLATAMDVHYGWKFFGCLFRKTVDCSHSSRVAAECSDQESDVSEHSLLCLPFADQFGFEGIVAGVEIRPELFGRLWDGLSLIGEALGEMQGGGGSGHCDAVQKGSACFDV